jgi:hypothetical protein
MPHNIPRRKAGRKGQFPSRERLCPADLAKYQADRSAIGLTGLPIKPYHIELFRVHRLHHGVKRRKLIPALGATDPGILV